MASYTGLTVPLLYGDRNWYQNNQLHRIDGPAYENPNNGAMTWYIKSIEYTENEYKELTK